jgi:hypothetical protein
MSGNESLLRRGFRTSIRTVPAFREYQRGGDGGSRKVRGKTVTVQRRGLMSLSEDAWAELGSPDTVTFLVDWDKRLIGFRPCRRNARNAIAVREPQRILSAIPVLKALGADLTQSRRYTLHVEDGLPPYIDLNEDAPVVTSNRKKPAESRPGVSL